MQNDSVHLSGGKPEGAVASHKYKSEPTPEIVAWWCRDLITQDVSIITDANHAKARSVVMYQGEYIWDVHPLCFASQKSSAGPDGWISIAEKLPRNGDGIRGKSDSGEWDEVWDRDEPLGRMTHWKPQTITREMDSVFWAKQEAKSGIKLGKPPAK